MMQGIQRWEQVTEMLCSLQVWLLMITLVEDYNEGYPQFTAFLAAP
jgi:hypothetical protein